jgi:hypothetical protein
MKDEQALDLSPRAAAAISELKGLISQRYPEAEFRLSRNPEDPDALDLKAIVDVDDTDEIVDLVIDRMQQLLIEDDLAIYVVPVRPLSRILTKRAARAAQVTTP